MPAPGHPLAPMPTNCTLCLQCGAPPVRQGKRVGRQAEWRRGHGARDRFRWHGDFCPAHDRVRSSRPYRYHLVPRPADGPCVLRTNELYVIPNREVKDGLRQHFDKVVESVLPMEADPERAHADRGDPGMGGRPRLDVRPGARLTRQKGPPFGGPSSFRVVSAYKRAAAMSAPSRRHLSFFQVTAGSILP